ncbi:MAG: hypothetical protein IH946_11485, partial [Bacteroidetes bacterium]|nr:hypothetical protein [Bacteroidota bacterium]
MLTRTFLSGSALTFLLGTSLLADNGRQFVDLITITSHEHQWYVEQYNLWGPYAKENDQDANAWYNYYKAARYAKLSAKPDMEWYKKGRERKNKVVDEMGKAIPNTFEFHYSKYWNAAGPENFDHLEKAHEIDPSRHEVY